MMKKVRTGPKAPPKLHFAGNSDLNRITLGLNFIFLIFIEVQTTLGRVESELKLCL